MNRPSHHLAAETLLDYASGAMDTAMQTLVACHLTVCVRCRRRAELADGLGGAALAALDPSPVAGSAERLLACAGDGGQRAAGDHTRRPPSIGVPRPLARLLSGPLDTLDWRRIAPGIKQINLADESRRDGAFKLLHLAPGVVLSGHTHNERELTYVVRGSYHDAIGRFRAGDVADLDGEVEHQPVVDTDESCIALIATDSPVRFTGLFGRLMQPFVGI